MRVATTFGLALVEAAAKAIKQDGNKACWPARHVAEKVDHEPNAGTKEVKSINVHCSQRTHDHIAVTTGVDVWK